MRSLSIFQRFSIGLRSGDCTGHDRERILCSPFQMLTEIALWARAPSSWNIGLRYRRFIRFQNGKVLFSTISMYFFWSTEPSMVMIGPNLSQKKHAHIIKDPPPNLIVGEIPWRLGFSCLVLLYLRSCDLARAGWNTYPTISHASSPSMSNQGATYSTIFEAWHSFWR